MLRSLFKTRRIRVPVEDAINGHQVQRVKLYKGSLLFETLNKSEDNPEDKSRPQSFEDAVKRARAAAGQPVVIGKTANGQEKARFDAVNVLVLPIWFRKRMSPIYDSYSPEYKDFARIQSDPKKLSALKNQVIESLKEQLQKNPQHQKSLDFINFENKIRVVIDFVPQLRPPPICESPAIIIYKDGIGFGWKIWRPEIGDRLLRILKPTATWEASKASVRAFIQVTKAMAEARGQNKEVVFDGRRVVLRELGTDKGPTKQSKQLEQVLATISGNTPVNEMHSEVLSNVPLSTAIQFAVFSFRNHQRANMIAGQQSTARGAILIKGTAKCIGETGSYAMQLSAMYLPSEDKFLGPLKITNTYTWQDYALLSSRQDDRKKKRRQQLRELRTSMKPPNTTDVDAETPEPKVDKPGK